MVKFDLAVDVARMVEIVGGQFTPKLAFRELADNCKDAGAKVIYVGIQRDKLYFEDDGHGMVSTILHSDAMQLEDYQDSDGDVLQYILRCSKASLEWWYTKIGFSSKTPEMAAEQGIRGMYGTGSLSVQRLGKKWTIYTRPTRELAKEWNDGLTQEDLDRGCVPIDLKNIPTYKLTPPTAEALARKEIGMEIEVSDKDLWSIWGGGKKEHGTLIIIEDLKIKVGSSPSQYNEQVLLDHLGSLYRQALAAGELEMLAVIDWVSKNARQNATDGIRHQVQPRAYKGVQLADPEIEEVVVLNGQHYRFKAEIYWDPTLAVAGVSEPDGEDPYVRVSYMRQNTFPVHEIIDHEFFRRGDVYGYIGWPPYLNNAELWTTSKNELGVDSSNPWVQAYVKKVLQLTPKWADRMKEREEQVAAEEVESFQDDFHAAAVKALEQLPNVGDDVSDTTKPKKSSRGRSKGKSSRKVETAVKVTIVNEHGDPARNIMVILTPQRGEVKRMLAKAGRVSFGRQDPGLYNVRIEATDEETQIYGESKTRFTLTEMSPGKRLLFRVFNNQPAIPKLSSQAMEIILKKSMQFMINEGDLDPWSQRIASAGIVDFNLANPELAEAMRLMREDRKEDLLIELVTQYFTEAINEYRILKYMEAHDGRMDPYTVHTILAQGSMYFPILKHSLVEIRRKSNQARRRKAKKKIR